MDNLWVILPFVLCIGLHIIMMRRHGGHPDDVYSCPMHPEVRENKPGSCSKCGMTLEKTKKSS